MIAVIDYGINDTDDLAQALNTLNVDFKITRNEREILDCEKIIISDSTNLSKAVKRIHLYNLFSVLRLQKHPVLGISMGMELLCNTTNDGITCLGLIPSELKQKNNDEIIESEGKWETVHQLKASLLFENIPNDSKFFFNNSYYTELSDSTVATVGNSEKYSAAIIKENFYGVQFLPEKSGEYGCQLLDNFISMC
ncbi:MAG: imidazole glycerol phosphate synthase subunit HisH [Bacteroidota bacterium]